MKIGFSLSACVMDIYEGKVAIEDVFLIQSGTKIEDTSIEYVSKIVQAYAWDGRMWGDNDATTKIMRDLLISGRVYQPRVVNHRPVPVAFNEHWADLAPTTLSTDENVKAAWNNYQLIMRLAIEDKPVMPQHLVPSDNTKVANEPSILPPLNDNF